MIGKAARRIVQSFLSINYRGNMTAESQNCKVFLKNEENHQDVLFAASYRLLPKKKSPSIPGPTWAPVKGSWGQTISSLGAAAS